ncbi:RraA family protein [Rhizobium leguminosarum]|uniref:RraA family protein n=1 Tax=Rhizobium leguminosarum TaxID=384 RepID=UPI000FEC73EF|nr:RraA family protein [Rhizobium leguminosarum]RWX35217.1 RraA family protein [Rhizobium leguminosarum]
MSPEVFDQLSAISTTLMSDTLDRLNGINGLKRFDNGGRLVGTALTVKTRPGDNLAIYRALSFASPGQILVVDGGGAMDNALVGGLLLDYALQRKVRGFVIDGAIRDLAEFEARTDFGCFARGVVHKGPYKDGPGRINVPVSIGGQVVADGDIIVGDEDGLLTFSATVIDDVLRNSKEREAAEARIREEILTGTVEQSWITAMMKTVGDRVR